MYEINRANSHVSFVNYMMILHKRNNILNGQENKVIKISEPLKVKVQILIKRIAETEMKYLKQKCL